MWKLARTLPAETRQTTAAVESSITAEVCSSTIRPSLVTSQTENAGSGGGALSVAGVLRFDNSTISENQAARAGGGVEVIDGRAVFNTATLDSNTTGVVLSAAPGNGGALHVSGSQTVVTFSDSTIRNNSAANQGGGLWNETGSTLILNSDTNVV